jgi:hypothetical protein
MVAKLNINVTGDIELTCLCGQVFYVGPFESGPFSKWWAHMKTAHPDQLEGETQ